MKYDWASDPTRPGEGNITGDHGAWKTLERELEYDGAFVKVFSEKVVTPSRAEGVSWTVVRRKSAVAIAAKTVDERWLLVRQERIPIRRAIWEFPAGQIEKGAGDFETLQRGEDASGTSDGADAVATPGEVAVSQNFEALQRETVWRELREETGYEKTAESTLVPLGVFFPSAGFTDEHSYIFLADALVPHPGGALPDEAESITECRAFTSEELREMIASGEICDANTLATYARLVATGFI